MTSSTERPNRSGIFLAICLCLLLCAGVSFAQELHLDVVRDYREVTNIAASNELVFFATTNGILRYNKGREQWDLLVPRSTFFDWPDIDRIEASTFGNLSVHTVLSWYDFDPLTESWFPSSGPPRDQNYETIPIPQNLQAPSGGLLIDRGRFLDASGRSIPIVKVIDDHSGYYWLATGGAGPARTRSASGVIELLTVGLAQPRVDVMKAAGDSLWLGGLQTQFRGGLTVIHNDLSTFTQITTGINGRVQQLDLQSLLVAGDTLYCGTNQGLQLLLPEITQVVRSVNIAAGLPSDRVTALVRDGDSIFVGTDRGMALVWHDCDSVRLIRPVTLGNAFVYDLALIEGRLWIATDRGCFRWRRDTDQLQSFQDSSRSLGGHVFGFGQSENRLWMISPTSVVWLDLETGAQGLIHDLAIRRRFRALAVNEQFVAYGTERGVTVTAYRGKRQESREVLLTDGLPSAQITSLLFTGEYLWIGTDRGAARLECDRLGISE